MNFLKLSLISASLMLSTNAYAGVLTIHDSFGRIGTVDTTSGVAVVNATTAVLTDIAYAPDGTLYGIDFGNLYTVNPISGALNLIGSHGIFGANALVFNSDGILFAAGGNELYTLSLTTGAGNFVGFTGFTSAGDLSFVGSDLFLSTSSNQLVELNLMTGAGSVVGSIGFSEVFGLATDPLSGTLFGLSDLTLLAISASTGVGTSLFDLAGQGFSQIFGTSFFGEANPDPIPGPGAFLLMITGLGALLSSRRRSAST